MSGEVAVEVRVRGRVQGVGFRAWTQAEARARGLAGWARNEPDGSVAALVFGPADRVADMVAALHHGPMLARVDRVETRPAARPGGSDFDVLK